MPQYAQACAGSSTSSSSLTSCCPFAPPAVMSIMLSASSSNRSSSSSSVLRRRALSPVISSSPAPALMVAAESDTRWLPIWVKAPSMVTSGGVGVLESRLVFVRYLVRKCEMCQGGNECRRGGVVNLKELTVHTMSCVRSPCARYRCAQDSLVDVVAAESSCSLNAPVCGCPYTRKSELVLAAPPRTAQGNRKQPRAQTFTITTASPSARHDHYVCHVGRCTL